MINKKIALLFILGISNLVYSQGCSDAGFCTSDNIKHGTAAGSFKNTLKLGVNYGEADFDVAVYGMYLEYKYQLSEKVDVGIRMNYINQFRDNTSSSALSDGFIIADYKINATMAANIGFKIPFSNGNLKNNGIPLPMDFQPSLGTYDLVLGLSKKHKNFLFAIGYQQPLNKNKNTFFKPLNSAEFFTTNQFKRAPDFITRLGYSYKLNEKWNISPSLLPIYHLANDTFEDVIQQENQIEDSKGLTLNGNLLIQYQFNPKNAFEFSVGLPFLVRENRPDGLTRSIVLNLEYKIAF
jgi:hypothetical protein